MNSHFAVYKSEKDNNEGETIIKADSEFHIYRDNPFECGIDKAERIVLPFNDEGTDNDETDSYLSGLLKNIGIFDYVEAVDQNDVSKNLWKGRCKMAALFLVSVVFVLSLPSWRSFVLAFIFDVISLFCFIIWNFSWGEKDAKSRRGNKIKCVLEYDFGDDYRLLVRGGHDHMEYLILLPSEVFEGLANHLKSIPDGEFNGKGKVGHNDEDNTFCLVEKRLDKSGCGNAESIVIDYNNKTLHYSFTIF